MVNFRGVQLPLSLAKEIVKNDNKSDLEKEYKSRKCISCNYKEQWYFIRTCTYNAAGIPGEHSSYESIPVLENPPSKMNYYKIKFKMEYLDDYLKNFDATNIKKAINQLDYLEYVKRNHELMPRSYDGMICNKCLENPDYNRIKKSLKILRFLDLSPEAIKVIKKD